MVWAVESEYGRSKVSRVTNKTQVSKCKPQPIPNQARVMFRLTEQVVSNASCTARTPKSSLSCSLHCWPLGVPDQLVTDLVTSAPLELLHLLAAEDR